MKYSIKVNRTSQEHFDNIVVWLDINNNPPDLNDIDNPSPSYLTYAAMCYRQSVLQNLEALNGNADQLCNHMVLEFNEDFKMVTNNIRAATDAETVANMLKIVESFICSYIYSLEQA